MPDTTAPPTSNQRFISWWIVATLASHLIVTITYALVNNFRPSGTRGWSIAVLVGLIAGVLLLGVMQGFVLMRYVPSLNWVKWAIYTAGAYVLAISFIATWIWLEAIAESQALGQKEIAPDYADPVLGVRLLIYFLMLVLLMCLQGALVGYTQSRVLGLLRPNKSGWVRINTVITSLSAFFLSIAILGMNEYKGYELFAGLFAVLGGILAGVSSGQTLVRYMHPTSLPQSTR